MSRLFQYHLSARAYLASGWLAGPQQNDLCNPTQQRLAIVLQAWRRPSPSLPLVCVLTLQNSHCFAIRCCNNGPPAFLDPPPLFLLQTRTPSAKVDETQAATSSNAAAPAPVPGASPAPAPATAAAAEAPAPVTASMEETEQMLAQLEELRAENERLRQELENMKVVASSPKAAAAAAGAGGQAAAAAAAAEAAAAAAVEAPPAAGSEAFLVSCLRAGG